MLRFFIFSLLLFSISSCAFQSITRSKDITFTDPNASFPSQKLDVYAPKKAKNLPVIVFFYGGSWKSGAKKMYHFLGNRLARRDVIMVLADYPLSPEFQIPAMQEAALKAVNWTKEHIQDYGGNPDKIFVSGHSAGGHLASLIAVKEQELDASTTHKNLAGSILIDPAGMDMYGYLQKTSKGEGAKYLPTFTDDPKIWKKYSTAYFPLDHLAPMLILEGERTYPSIRAGRRVFMKHVEEAGIEDVTLKIYSKKKHIPMITQFLWTPGKVYKDVLSFINEN